VRALHERIRSDIEARITSGEWAPGTRIPFEHELMRTWTCSRMTVNKALTALQTAGLIERRRKAGSFVAAPRLSSMVLDIPDLEAEAHARGESYQFRLLSRREVDDQLELTGVHVTGGRPLCHEYRVIDLATVPEARDADFSVVPPGTWLLKQVPWSEARTTIGAIQAGKTVGGLLDLDPHTACLRVDRTTWRDGRIVTVVEQVFDGAHYYLIARFRP